MGWILAGARPWGGFINNQLHMFAALVESGDVLELGYVLLRVEIIIQVDTGEKKKKKKGCLWPNVRVWLLLLWLAPL